MFSKASSNRSSGGQAVKPPAPSILSGDLKVLGDLRSEGEIHIDGSVEGDVDSKILVIGEKANVTGQITAETLRVLGSVNGAIKARSVHLAKTAHVVGDILHEDIVIERGAFLEGHVRRMDTARTATGTPLSVVSKDTAEVGKA